MADVDRISTAAASCAGDMARARPLRRWRASAPGWSRASCWRSRCSSSATHAQAARAAGRAPRRRQALLPQGRRRRARRRAAARHRRRDGRRAASSRACTVAQRFVNPTGEWREGVYVLPAAGEGRRRPPAHADRRARDRGHDPRARRGAARLRAGEGRRPQGDAGRAGASRTCSRPASRNIGPGEEVVVTIEYQQTLRYDDGTFRLRFPLAITPRYIPGTPVAARRRPAWAGRRRRSRCSTPTASRRRSRDRRDGYVNPVTLADRPRRRLSAGAAREPLPRVERRGAARPSLPPDARRRPGAGRPRLRARLDARRRRARRGAALFTETQGRQDYALLMVLPPSLPSAACRALPREVDLRHRHLGLDGRRVDRAGARGAAAGARPAAAGRSLQRHRVQLATPRRCSRAPMPVDAGDARAARARSSAGLRARGGTEMLPALDARARRRRATPALLRQVVFLTDGAVGNEDELFALIRDAARRPAAVHGRHRLGAQRVLHDARRRSSAAARTPSSATSAR